MKNKAFLLLFVIGLPMFAWAQEPANLPRARLTPTAYEDPALVQSYQATITENDLAAHLYFFASDFFEGRETTARGQKMAAHYLAGQYRKLGLQPKGTIQSDDPRDPAAYLQPFDLNEGKLKKATMSVHVNGATVQESVFSAEAQSGDFAWIFGNDGTPSGSVIFAGYGIADDALNYNDYSALQNSQIDVNGKWLLILRDEPLASKDASLLATEDGKPSAWTGSVNQKLRAVFQQGAVNAAGILIVSDIGPNATPDFAVAVRQRGQALAQDVGSLSVPGTPARTFSIPPIFQISAELANHILAPSGQTVADLQTKINQSLTPYVFEVMETQVRANIENETRTVTSENVAAFIEGSDPALKDEVVVISSHYDHIGTNWGSSAEDIINNGADDDGSGTVGVLEIAEAFMNAVENGHGPRRSVLFLNVSGEEKGLLGSAYFTDQEPVVPLENIVTNLNIDMIGRFDPTHPTQSENYVYIIGSNLISQELHDINLKINDITGTKLLLDERFNSKDDPNQFYRRSDHWNFGKHQIPFIFFFTGTHDDYHGVDDEAHKIEYERMTRISQLIFATAWQVANQDKRPVVSGTGFNN